MYVLRFADDSVIICFYAVIKNQGGFVTECVKDKTKVCRAFHLYKVRSTHESVEHPALCSDFHFILNRYRSLLSQQLLAIETGCDVCFSARHLSFSDNDLIPVYFCLFVYVCMYILYGLSFFLNCCIVFKCLQSGLCSDPDASALSLSIRPSLL